MNAPDRHEALAAWKLILDDSASLLDNPGRQHKILVQQAHALRRAHVIDRDDLSDMLELADGALAYAVEALLDPPKPLPLYATPTYSGPADIIFSGGDGDVTCSGLWISLDQTSPCTMVLRLPNECPDHSVGMIACVTLPDGFRADGPVTWCGAHSLVFSVVDEWGRPRCKSLRSV